MITNKLIRSQDDYNHLLIYCHNLLIKKGGKMKIKFLDLSIMLMLVLGSVGLHAQEALPAAGKDVTGSGGSVSFSVGQVFYAVHQGASAEVTCGIQQPFDISVIASIEEAKTVNLYFEAFPNPATDYLVLEAKGLDASNL